jgi:hypothetical protein
MSRWLLPVRADRRRRVGKCIQTEDARLARIGGSSKLPSVRNYPRLALRGEGRVAIPPSPPGVVPFFRPLQSAIPSPFDGVRLQGGEK